MVLPFKRRLVRIGVDVAVVVAFVPVLLVVLESFLALFGVRPKAYEEDPYIGFSSWAPLFVDDPDDVEKNMLVTARNKRNLFNLQRFPAQKPERTYRIFCLGGSTTYGHPFNDSTSFSAWLRTMLPEADPSRDWEVINAGGISYASYRIARLMEDLVAYSPDLFIVYTGHNEFLEERTYRDIRHMPAILREIAGVAANTRIFTVAGRVRQMLEATGSGDLPDNAMLPGEVSAILDESVGPDAYHRDDTLRGIVLEHFRLNLERMIGIAESAGAGVVLVTPASNLRDFSPFKSEHRTGISENERSRFDDHMARGVSAFEGSRLAEAVAQFREAVAVDGRYAEAQYRLARALWATEKFAEAAGAFRLARDEDICPLRALTPMREIVLDVAAEHGAPVVDFQSMLEDTAAHNVPGNEQFVDHVHPAVEVHGKLAEAIVLTMVGRGWVRPSSLWDGSVTARAANVISGAFNDDTRAESLRNLAKVMGWAGKFEEAYTLARQAFELAPNHPESTYGRAIAAMHVGRDEESLSWLQQTIDIQPDHSGALLRLGNAMSVQGDPVASAELFRRLIDADADTAYLGHNNLANELAALGKTEEAIEHYEEALRLRPDYVAARGNLGLALTSAGREEEAVAHYTAALAADPENGPIHYNLGVLLLDRGEPEKASDHLRDAVRLMPDYAPASVRLGEALERVAGRND